MPNDTPLVVNDAYAFPLKNKISLDVEFFFSTAAIAEFSYLQILLSIVKER
jgi:alanine-alpha-ketoisovalerate/valine-pyruvate aminotransferase